MCGEQASGSTAPGQKWGWSESDTPPDWENIDLPPDHILKHREPYIPNWGELTSSDRRPLSSNRPQHLY